MFECPKTFVKNKSIQFLNLIDSLELGKLQISNDATKVSNRFMEMFRLVSTERAKVQRSIAERNSKGK